MMQKANNAWSRHDLVMQRPASVFCNRWMDGTPIGSGKTGVVFYGGVSGEHLIFNCGDVWHNGKDASVPDVSNYLQEMRDLYESGKKKEACSVMYNALKNAEYATTLADFRTLGEINIVFACRGVYSDYQRVLHLDTSEAEVSYRIDGVAYRRRYFASREKDFIAMHVESEKETDFSLHSGFFNSFEGGQELVAKEADLSSAEYRVLENCYVYSTVNVNDGKYFGIVVRVETDGEKAVSDEGIAVKNTKSALVLAKAFSASEDLKSSIQECVKTLQSCQGDYDTVFQENLPLYKKLYDTADVQLYDGEYHTNEELLLQARQAQMPSELAEKLWRFGRYLFISGTGKNALPVPLYGLWCCGYHREFTHHVANENVQSIYWHTDVGGLSELVVPLLDYYYSNIDKYKENAKQLYGCRGIFIGTYTTPVNAKVAWWVPVILHFTGVAGWLSSHFYRYYQFSGDEKLFEEKILPFMLEAVTFYEDYHYYDKNGVFTLYPAVSPENSPMEFYDKEQSHPMPVTKNPTVEIAILKELLTSLLQVAKTRPQLKERVSVWEKMLADLPKYRVNEDGAIAEWIDKELTDVYDHRHVSHLYPVFPATEIEDSDDKSLLPAFKRALDLREKGSFYGWSMPHMSAIYSRMQKGEEAYSILNALSKVCLLENLLTLGHDFRDMGITGYECGPENVAPVQLDALFGHVNALQEMFLFATAKRIRLLPACPKLFHKGNAKLHFTTGVIAYSWNVEEKECHGEITALRNTDILLELPFDGGTHHVQICAGQTYRF